MVNDSIDLCRCHSGKAYSVCCKKYHEGAPPENALVLMRSRYSAYAMRLIDYIINTTHPNNPQYIKNHGEWKEQIKDFCLITKFISLKILDFVEGEKVSFVTFRAGMRQKSEDASFTERSRFEKMAGRWLYHSGEVSLQKEN
ncbi:MAG: YchJ family metal-binding protein [Chlamydiota bacterium]|nr:YchJ family metal-binding protein [Chlamydiota bacterium]